MIALTRIAFDTDDMEPSETVVRLFDDKHKAHSALKDSVINFIENWPTKLEELNSESDFMLTVKGAAVPNGELQTECCATVTVGDLLKAEYVHAYSQNYPNVTWQIHEVDVEH